MAAIAAVPLATGREELTMKNPREISDTCWNGPDELKRTANRLKRLAGGLRSEVTASSHGLSEKEAAALRTALTLTDEMASRYSKAAALSKKRIEERTKAEKGLRLAMAKTFLALSSIEDKIAFIAAAHSYRLRVGSILSRQDLDYYFTDDLNSFIYRLSGEINDGTPTLVAADAWAKFTAARDELTQRHHELILRLSRDS